MHAQALVLFNPYAFLQYIFTLSHSFPLMSANASVHSSCAPEVSPPPNCETVAIFLWPANRPFVGCLLRLDAQPVLLLLAGSDSCPAARLLPRLAFRNSPSGATGFGAGAAAAAVDHEAEAAWCCGTGGGAGGTSHCS